MSRQIFSNRWFIWTIVGIVVIGVSLWAYIQYALIEMDIESSKTDVVLTITIHKSMDGGDNMQEIVE